MEDHKIYKHQLVQYLNKKGHYEQPNGKWHCIAPDHADSDPSMSVYESATKGEGNYANCNSCSFSGDIFVCSGVIIGRPGTDKESFKAQLDDVKRTLGAVTSAEPVKPPAKKNKAEQESKYVSLPPEEARKIYTVERITELANYVFNTNKKTKKPIPVDDPAYKDFTVADKFNPFINENGNIDIVTVRFDYHDRIKDKPAKDILTFWYDGKKVLLRNYPVLIYNRLALAESDKPVLWHEGEKCVDAAIVNLEDFTHATWNGGGKKVNIIRGLESDCFKNRDHFIIPDDDQKLDKTGILLPKDKQPGYETALKLKEKIEKETGEKAYIVDFFTKAREIKPDGADIVEILQCYSIEEITEQILRSKRDEQEKFVSDKLGKEDGSNEIHDSGRQGKADDRNQEEREQKSHSGDLDSLYSHDSGGDNYPFQILGIADDGQAYFIDYQNRIASFKTTSLSGDILSDLGGYQWFKAKYHGKDPSANEWKEEIDDVRRIAKQKDFNVDSLRGRGAWRSRSGDICYHDGRETIGKYDPSWTFVRRPKRCIGIKKKPLDLQPRMEIQALCKTFSFSTSADAVRVLSWSVLAPFGGALKWRTAILITGESGTGKSTIMDNVVIPISAATPATGTNTTEAGIRQFCGMDSNGVCIDEAEKRKQRDKERMDGIFSLMRGSTTDDAPKSLKGTISGHAMTFQMKSMFCFAAIDPTVDDTANDNRIIRINLKKVNNFDTFTKSLKKIKRLLTPDNCDRLRSYVWSRLREIIDLGERLEFIIQRETGQDARFAAGESILLAANLIVWEDFQTLTDDFLHEYVRNFYHGQRQEKRRDETDELITDLLDHTVYIGEPRTMHSLRELLIEMKKYIDDQWAKDNAEVPPGGLQPNLIGPGLFNQYRTMVEQCGLTVHKATRELFISHNHVKVMDILDLGRGYHRQLERHEKVMEYKGNISISTRIDGVSRRGTVIAGFLDYLSNED